MRESRRTFLQQGAAGLSLTWGGLRLFAGPAGSEPVRADQFIYGAHVYRPPNPPRAMRREVLRTIAEEHRFNLIRCYPTWDYYHLGPGRYNFEEIEEVMQSSDEFGLKVMMGVVLETAPYWLEQVHPETRFVDAKGHPQPLESKAARVWLSCWTNRQKYAKNRLPRAGPIWQEVRCPRW
jgi:glycosyl hydrolase family 42 (putative beta-galactosidase)